MSLNSEHQEMDKHIQQQQLEIHTKYVKKDVQKPEEEQPQENHTISDAPTPPTTTYPPPRNHIPSSPQLECLSPSSLSSDRSFHGNELKHPIAHLEASPPAVANRAVRPDPAVVAKVDPRAQDGFTSVGEVEVGSNNRGGGDRRVRLNLSILRRTRRENMLKKALLGLRISGFVFCLISFSVMAADKDQGWALDSFYRYKEFRYCMAVNVIGFAYSGLQLYDLVNYFTTGKHIVRHHLRYYFDFSMDQMLAYLLISASSSAATRVYDWQSNWGKDKFTEMASASMGCSFVACLAFALSSLISGYTICKTS